MIAGALLLQVAFTLDCVDGQLARYTRTFSKFGAWLDSIFDRTKEYVVFAGLAIGASRTGDDVWVLAGAALTLQTMRHAIDFSFPAAQHQAIGRGAPAAARAGAATCVTPAVAGAGRRGERGRARRRRRRRRGRSCSALRGALAHARPLGAAGAGSRR